MTIDEETIRHRAYQLWEARGRPLGSAEIDWFAALRLLLEEGEGASGAAAPEAGHEPRYGLRELVPH